MRCHFLPLLEDIVIPQSKGQAHASLLVHIESCAVCRHEVGWLTTERMLVRQRALRMEREEPNFFLGLTKKAVDVPQPHEFGWMRALGRLATGATAMLAILLAIVVGPGHSTSDEVPHITEQAMKASRFSPRFVSEEHTEERFVSEELCSRLPVGMQLRCGPALVSQATPLRSANPLASFAGSLTSEGDSR